MSSTRPSPQQPQTSSVPQSLSLINCLKPIFSEATLIKEYCLFAQIQQQSSPVDAQSLAASQDNLNSTAQAKMLTGVYVIPSAQSHFLWFGCIALNNDRGYSPWHGGVFRFFIRFPDNYPSAMPSITFLPTKQTNGAYSTISTHPDISPSGNLNLRPYVTTSTLQTTPQTPKIYKILRCVRKAFYKQFNESDPRDSVNPAAAEMIKTDYAEFLRNCAIDASESLAYVHETDKFILQKFKNDSNCVLLGATQNGTNGVDNKQDSCGVKPIGLSFMQA